jgi:hypothetical protein
LTEAGILRVESDRRPAGDPAQGSEAGAGGSPAVGLSPEETTGQARRRVLMVVDERSGELREIDEAGRRIARMRKRVRRWASAVERIWGDPAYLPIMVTLTYRPGVEWEPEHVKEYMRRVRRRLGAYLAAYAWVAELQQRGAVHYHVLIVQKRGRWLPKPDRSGDWTYGDSKVEKARSAYYVAKYAQKQGAGDFPKGLRLFSVVLKEHVAGGAMLAFLRLSVLPAWLEEEVRFDVMTSDVDLPARRKGGGWDHQGKLLRSPFRLVMRWEAR